MFYHNPALKKKQKKSKKKRAEKPFNVLKM
jgi:hypothetical protein